MLQLLLIICVTAGVHSLPHRYGHEHGYEHRREPYPDHHHQYDHHHKSEYGEDVFKKFAKIHQYNGYGNNQQQVQARPYQHGGANYQSQDYYGSANYKDFFTKMIGEQFFKAPAVEIEEEEPETREEIPYTILQNFGPYELREYPATKFVCVMAQVDGSKDPLAGMDNENSNPLAIMGSQRWKKTPSSIMFKELFKYIAGVNKEGEEVEMTRPVSTHHIIKEKQTGGDVEEQEMCFYLPSVHQANPPTPLDNSPVYIKERAAMHVYARAFGGFLFTHEAWKRERELLEHLIIGKKHVVDKYYTNGYNSPFTFRNRRNEVWIQCLEDGQTLPIDLTEVESVGTEDLSTEVREVDEEEEEEGEEEVEVKPAPVVSTKPIYPTEEAAKPLPAEADKEAEPVVLPAEEDNKEEADEEEEEEAEAVSLPAEAVKSGEAVSAVALPAELEDVGQVLKPVNGEQEAASEDEEE